MSVLSRLRLQASPARGVVGLRSGLGLRLVEAAYVILLGFLFTRLVYGLLTPLEGPRPVAPTAIAPRAVDLTVFSRFDPFMGRAPAIASPTVQAVETRLNLRLVGTFVTAGRASATIVTEDGRQQAYAIGDEVGAGVTVTDILTDQVLLSRGGAPETLSLEGRDVVPVAPPAGPAPSVPGASALGAAVSAAGALDIVRIENDGSGRGVVLRAGSNPQLFEISGLIDGDRLLAVDGVPISPSGAELSALPSKLARGTVSLSIERDGVPLQIVLDQTGLVQ